MTSKRKPKLQQVFKAWLKLKQKQSEAHQASLAVTRLSKQFPCGETELIAHEGYIYRITISYCNEAKIERIACAEELPSAVV